MWLVKFAHIRRFCLECNNCNIDVCQQFNGVQVNGCSTKFVFKPATASGMWKVVCEPKHGDLRLLTKKIPIGPLFHLQVFFLEGLSVIDEDKSIYLLHLVWFFYPICQFCS